MKNQKKIIEEIKAVGLRVKVHAPGLVVYPSEEDDYMIYTPELDALVAIAKKYGLGHYINFSSGYIRVYN